MTTDSRRIDYAKVPRLKQVGIALAGLWVVILIAAIAATIAGSDGTVRSIFVTGQSILGRGDQDKQAHGQPQKQGRQRR